MFYGHRFLSAQQRKKTLNIKNLCPPAPRILPGVRCCGYWINCPDPEKKNILFPLGIRKTGSWEAPDSMQIRFRIRLSEPEQQNISAKTAAPFRRCCFYIGSVLTFSLRRALLLLRTGTGMPVPRSWSGKQWPRGFWYPPERRRH